MGSLSEITWLVSAVYCMSEITWPVSYVDCMSDITWPVSAVYTDIASAACARYTGQPAAVGAIICL